VKKFLDKNVTCDIGLVAEKPVNGIGDAKPVNSYSDIGTDTCGTGTTTGPWEFYPEALSEFAGQHASLKHVFRKERNQPLSI
jgi:hypothetical protein